MAPVNICAISVPNFRTINIKPMPQSVYQTALKTGLIQAEFHPKSDRLILLSKSGDLICKTVSGEDSWDVRLECDP